MPKPKTPTSVARQARNQTEPLPFEIGDYLLEAPLLQATTVDRQPRLRVTAVGSRFVVLGRGSNPHKELFVDRIVNDNITVLRRRGGGCAVFLDPGNVVLELTLPVQGLGGNDTAFAAISRWIGAGLANLGIPDISQRGICDLAIGERKIGGACIYRPKSVLLYSVSLLVNPDIEAVQRYLRHPPREPDYRQGRSHGDFMGSLGALADIEKPKEFANKLAAQLIRTGVGSIQQALSKHGFWAGHSQLADAAI